MLSLTNEIRKLAEAGKSQAAIAAETGLAQEHVRGIIKNLRHGGFLATDEKPTGVSETLRWRAHAIVHKALTYREMGHVSAAVRLLRTAELRSSGVVRANFGALADLVEAQQGSYGPIRLGALP